MLGQDNPIQNFGEIFLFESDLEDCGYAVSKVRYRVMADCYYVLLRYFLRVDGVCVRILDTRIFHAFGENFIRREFQYRQSSYDEIKKTGFKLDSEWNLSTQADDMIFPKLEMLSVFNEKIMI
jgi:type 2A phosphatase activator TIP41